MLEVDKKRQSQPGSVQVAEALGQVDWADLIDALQFHDELVFNDQIRDVFPNEGAFVIDRIGHLGADGDPSGGQFGDQGPFVELLQKTSAKHIGDFVRRSNDGLGD